MRDLDMGQESNLVSVSLQVRVVLPPPYTAQ
jgi:hypothetical protein